MEYHLISLKSDKIHANTAMQNIYFYPKPTDELLEA